MLEKFFQIAGEPKTTERARHMADLTAKGLLNFFDHEHRYFRANLYDEEGKSKVIGALETFAVPLYLGLKDMFKPYKHLIDLFKEHTITCL